MLEGGQFKVIVSYPVGRKFLEMEGLLGYWRLVHGTVTMRADIYVGDGTTTNRKSACWFLKVGMRTAARLSPYLIYLQCDLAEDYCTDTGVP